MTDQPPAEPQGADAAARPMREAPIDRFFALRHEHEYGLDGKCVIDGESWPCRLLWKAVIEAAPT